MGLRVAEQYDELGPSSGPGRFDARSVLDHIADAVAHFDEELRLTYVNPAMARVLGLSHETPRETILGRLITELPISASAAQSLASAIAAARARDGAHSFYMAANADGALLEARCFSESDARGNHRGVVLITREPPRAERHHSAPLSRTSEAIARARESEARLRRIFESNIVAIGGWKAGGVLTQANDALLALCGRARSEVAGGDVDWSGIVAPEERAAWSRSFSGLDRDGVLAPFETAFARPDGSRVPVLVGATAWDGQRDEGVFFALDISERKYHEQSQRFLAAAGEVLASSLDYERTLEGAAGLAVPAYADWCFVDLLIDDLTMERVVVTVSEACSGLADRARKGCFHISASGNSPNLVDPILFPTVTDDELMSHARADSRIAPLCGLGIRSYMIVPMMARARTIGSLLFASACWNYDDANLACARELAHRAALAIDNARLYREARDAVRIREDFLSIASHELKTPLSSLQLHLQNLQRNLSRGDLAPDALRKRLDTANRLVERQGRLVEQLLDVSRLTAGRLELVPEEADLTQLVREVAERFDQQLSDCGSPFTIDGDASAIGCFDRVRVDQVVTNLLSNAIKYGNGQPIHMTIRSVGTVLTVEVADGGVGIPLEAQARIFSRFERAVPGRNYGGFGLGLWITKNIVDAMGGTITVSSAPDAGARFTVVIPREPP